MNALDQEEYEELMQEQLAQEMLKQAMAKTAETKEIKKAAVEVAEVSKLNRANVSVLVAKRLSEPGSCNMLICGKTQLGKTDLAGAAVTEAINKGLSVVLSTSNHDNLLLQTVRRINDCIAASDLVFKPEVITYKTKKYAKHVKKMEHENKSYVLVILDNASSVTKLTNLLYASESRDKKLYIHDEGDAIIKNNSMELMPRQKLSHAAWINHFAALGNAGVDYTRLFVTATPEAVLKLVSVKAENVFMPIVPKGYRGVKDLQFQEYKGSMSMVKNACDAIKERGTHEVVVIVDSRYKNIQIDQIDDLQRVCEMTVCTYQGSGILTRFNTEQDAEKFAESVSHSVKRIHRYTNSPRTVKVEEFEIADYLDTLLDIGIKSCIVIGKDMITRGTTLVSRKRRLRPMVATTMFLTNSPRSHAVGIIQQVGRINGTCMPTYQRRLFTSKDCWETIINFDKNQDIYADKLQDSINTGEYASQVLLTGRYHPVKYLDRPELRLGKIGPDMPPSPPLEIEGEIDGVRLVNLRRWVEADTVVGRMVRGLYMNPGRMSSTEFKEVIEYTGSMTEFESNIRGGVTGAGYGKLWIYRDGQVEMNPRIREYLDTM